MGEETTNAKEKGKKWGLTRDNQPYYYVASVGFSKLISLNFGF